MEPKKQSDSPPEPQAEEQKPEKPLQKTAKKEPGPPPKFYYDVKIECMLPATLTWRVQAENPQQAFELVRRIVPQTVKHRLIGRKDLKVTVFDFGSTFIKWMRNLV